VSGEDRERAADKPWIKLLKGHGNERCWLLGRGGRGWSGMGATRSPESTQGIPRAPGTSHSWGGRGDSGVCGPTD